MHARLAAVAAVALAVLAAAAAADAAAPSNVMIWGELFSNSSITQTVFEPVAMPGSVPFVDAASGQQFACLLTADGRAYCVGSNQRGQLGVGEDVQQSGVPQPVAGGKRYRSVLVAAWASYACGLLDAPGTPQDRTLECWCAVGGHRRCAGSCCACPDGCAAWQFSMLVQSCPSTPHSCRGQSSSVWQADPLLINSTTPQPFMPDWAWEQAVIADGEPFVCAQAARPPTAVGRF